MSLTLDELISEDQREDPEEEFEEAEETDEDVQANLSNALSMLQDCGALLDRLWSNKKIRSMMSSETNKTLLELTQEVAAFLSDFDADEKEDTPPPDDCAYDYPGGSLARMDV